MPGLAFGGQVDGDGIVNGGGGHRGREGNCSVDDDNKAAGHEAGNGLSCVCRRGKGDEDVLSFRVVSDGSKLNIKRKGARECRKRRVRIAWVTREDGLPKRMQHMSDGSAGACS